MILKIKINNENEMDIFKFISDINKNHIKKYKTILKFLNLNLVLEKNIDKPKEEVKENSKKESNIAIDSQIKDKEVILEQKKDDKIIAKEITKNPDNLEEKINVNGDITSNKENSVKNEFCNIDNNNIKDELNNSEEIKNIEKKEIDDNNSLSIIDYKDNVNYFRNDDISNELKKKKFFLEDDDDDLEIENEDNNIIINENDDAVPLQALQVPLPSQTAQRFHSPSLSVD